jgi:hypothetical protein
LQEGTVITPVQVCAEQPTKIGVAPKPTDRSVFEIMVREEVVVVPPLDDDDSGATTEELSADEVVAAPAPASVPPPLDPIKSSMKAAAGSGDRPAKKVRFMEGDDN